MMNRGDDSGSTIGARLRLERNRQKMTARAFAAATGVTERTQRSYEGDARVPNAAYLAAALSLGVDVEFVLGGSLRSIRILSESAQAMAVISAVEAVEDACAEGHASLSVNKRARLIAVVHRMYAAGTEPTRDHLRALVELAAEGAPEPPQSRAQG